MKAFLRSERRERGASATISTKTTNSTTVDESVTTTPQDHVFTPVRIYQTHTRRNFGQCARSQNAEVGMKSKEDERNGERQ